MAQEAKRGCGYRKVGGIYLVGDGLIAIGCDRLPYPLETCPVCGEGIRQSRAMRRINPVALFDDHDGCTDKVPACFVCQPAAAMDLVNYAPAYVAWVGAKFYTPSSFVAEVSRQGVSKRIGNVPKEMIIGKSIVYLAHPDAVEHLLSTDNEHLVTAGVFTAFIPQRIEMPVWRDELTDEKKAELAKRGITAVPFDRDPDHEPNKGDD